MGEPEVTPPLGEFRDKYEKDDNEWWRLGSGHHQNLFDEACDEIDRLRLEVLRLTNEVRALERRLEE